MPYLSCESDGNDDNVVSGRALSYHRMPDPSTRKYPEASCRPHPCTRILHLMNIVKSVTYSGAKKPFLEVGEG